MQRLYTKPFSFTFFDRLLLFYSLKSLHKTLLNTHRQFLTTKISSNKPITFIIVISLMTMLLYSNGMIAIHEHKTKLFTTKLRFPILLTSLMIFMHITMIKSESAFYLIDVPTMSKQWRAIIVVPTAFASTYTTTFLVGERL